jgi:hypothetical protein
MAVHYGIKVVWGWPDEFKAINGIAPLAGKITLRFSNTSFATVQVNDGPELVLTDKGTHWEPCGELGKPNPIPGGSSMPSSLQSNEPILGKVGTHPEYQVHSALGKICLGPPGTRKLFPRGKDSGDQSRPSEWMEEKKSKKRAESLCFKQKYYLRRHYGAPSDEVEFSAWYADFVSQKAKRSAEARERSLARQRAYGKRPEIRARHRAWEQKNRLEHPEKWRAMDERYRNKPEVKVKKLLRRRLQTSVENQKTIRKHRTRETIGCSPANLVKWIGKRNNVVYFPLDAVVFP